MTSNITPFCARHRRSPADRGWPLSLCVRHVKCRHSRKMVSGHLVERSRICVFSSLMQIRCFERFHELDKFLMITLFAYVVAFFSQSLTHFLLLSSPIFFPLSISRLFVCPSASIRSILCVGLLSVAETLLCMPRARAHAVINGVSFNVEKWKRRDTNFHGPNEKKTTNEIVALMATTITDANGLEYPHR